MIQVAEILVTRGQEVAEAKENGQGKDRRGVEELNRPQSKESAPRASCKEESEESWTSEPAQGRRQKAQSHPLRRQRKKIEEEVLLGCEKVAVGRYYLLRGRKIWVRGREVQLEQDVQVFVGRGGMWKGCEEASRARARALMRGVEA